MRSLILFLRSGPFKRSFRLENKEATIIGVALSTSPTLLLDEDFYPGWRVAEPEDLELFARRYKRFGGKRWLPPIHALDREIKTTVFGGMTKLYETDGEGRIKQARQNPIWGVPRGTLFLFIRKATPPTV